MVASCRLSVDQVIIRGMASLDERKKQLRRALRKSPQTAAQLVERTGAAVNVRAYNRALGQLVADGDAVKVAGRPPAYRKP
jgi:hypothetical protein